MIEAILERIAVALEKLAEPVGDIIKVVGNEVKPGAEIIETITAATLQEDGVDYDKLVAEGKRDALLILCSERQIEVIKGTKTPTLAKMLKTYDAAHPATGGPADDTPDPFSAGAGGVDPFAAADTTGAGAVEATLEDAKAALQAIQATKGPEVGNPIIKGILKAVTGSEVFSALQTVAHFTAAVAKAKEVK